MSSIRQDPPPSISPRQRKPSDIPPFATKGFVRSSHIVLFGILLPKDLFGQTQEMYRNQSLRIPTRRTPELTECEQANPTHWDFSSMKVKSITAEKLFCRGFLDSISNTSQPKLYSNEKWLEANRCSKPSMNEFCTLGD